MSLGPGAAGAVIADPTSGAGCTTIVDGTARRLQVQTQSGTNTANTNATPAFQVRTQLLNGSTASLIAATGTVAAPAVYKYSANATRGQVITSIMTIFSIQTYYMRGIYFGYGVALPNGLLYACTTSTTGSQVTTNYGTVKVNEDWLALSGYDCLDINGSGACYYGVINFAVNVPLVAGTTDNVSVSVRDAMSGYNFYNLGVFAVGYYTS